VRKSISTRRKVLEHLDGAERTVRIRTAFAG
jgi:hypothetical protein